MLFAGLVVWVLWSMVERRRPSLPCGRCQSTEHGLRYARAMQLVGLSDALRVARRGPVPSTLEQRFTGLMCRSCTEQWMIDVLTQTGLSCSRCGGIHDVWSLPNQRHTAVAAQWNPLLGRAENGPNGAYFEIMCMRQPSVAWNIWSGAQAAQPSMEREHRTGDVPRQETRVRRSSTCDDGSGDEVGFAFDVDWNDDVRNDQWFEAGLDSGDGGSWGP